MRWGARCARRVEVRSVPLAALSDPASPAMNMAAFSGLANLNEDALSGSRGRSRPAKWSPLGRAIRRRRPSRALEIELAIDGGSFVPHLSPTCIGHYRDLAPDLTLTNLPRARLLAIIAAYVHSDGTLESLLAGIMRRDNAGCGDAIDELLACPLTELALEHVSQTDKNFAFRDFSDTVKRKRKQAMIDQLEAHVIERKKKAAARKMKIKQRGHRLLKGKLRRRKKTAAVATPEAAPVSVSSGPSLSDMVHGGERWGDFAINKNFSAVTATRPEGAVWARCPYHKPVISSNGTTWLWCMREIRVRASEGVTETVAMQRIKHWCVEAPLHTDDRQAMQTIADML